MTKHNANNERIKRSYFAYLKEARRYSEATVDATAKALDRFETYTKCRDFRSFHFEQAIAFKRHLAEQKAIRSKNALSMATLNSTLVQIKRFFQWLSDKPGYKSRFRYSDADYFNLSEKDARIATARREQLGPTLEQVKHVLTSMPNTTEIERRNRALIAFTILTGTRDRAVASIKLKHINLVDDCIHQDAREVKTKFSKSFDTYFFPIGAEIRSIVVDWVTFLRQEKLWSNDDPLFPATYVSLGTRRQFEASGLQRSHWNSTAGIRAIFSKAFTHAGLRYFNPHSFRNTLVRLGQEVCKTPEEFKAWSQNLGHEKPLTTFLSYGEVGSERQREILRTLAAPTRAWQPNLEDLAAALVKKIRDSQVGSVSLDENTLLNTSSPPKRSIGSAAAEIYVSKLKG